MLAYQRVIYEDSSLLKKAQYASDAPAKIVFLPLAMREGMMACNKGVQITEFITITSTEATFALQDWGLVVIIEVIYFNGNHAVYFASSNISLLYY